MANPRHDRALDDLRAKIARLERSHRAGRAVLPFGIADLDAHLPDGGLLLGALHEVSGGGPDLAHGAAAALFSAGILARLKGPVLWCLKARDLFGAALAGAGLHPDRVLYAETGDEALVLPIMEEALRHRGLAGVVAETRHLGLTNSRRLQLAAEGTGVTALVIRRWRGRDLAPTGGTVANTRWRVTSLPSVALASPGVGHPRWRLELLRCRGGEASDWIVEACDGAGRLRLAANVADRSAAPAVRRAIAG